MANVPGHCHALTENRAGQFAVDLWGSYRLVFEPGESPVPLLPDGGIDLVMVRRVRILEVTDYHGE